MRLQLTAMQDGYYLSTRTLLRLLIVFILGLGAALWLGYKLCFHNIGQQEGSLVGEWQHYLQSDTHKLKELQHYTEQHLQVLTQQMGKIEANLMRINALGEKLVEHAHLDSQEFNFNQEVGMGGPILAENEKGSLSTTLKELDSLLDKRYAQLTALHQALQIRLGQHELSFSGLGKPVNSGWVSSFFGRRHDPFTGNKAWHSGVDIVAKEGAEIKALASGVISFAAEKGGYGNLVEINHGNGLATRYGHNKQILVQPGELVRKGQTIALLGSSGRSTGPHVHIEVHKDGQPVDPGIYFSDLRKS